MATPLNVLPLPCTTCPYRKDVPAGIWDASEYHKLAAYDANLTLSVFLCHQSKSIGADTVCRGRLSVHCESVAARLAVSRGQVSADDLYAKVETPLYRSGAAAMLAGLKGVAKPGRKARKKIATLMKQKGIRR